jgi:ATP-dependent Clp protease ATP-binding subunit ClpB
VRRIVEIQINRIRPRLAERHVTLQLTEAAKDYLANEGYDPQFGARPLKRVIQREVENRLARALLNGEIPDGATVNIDVENDRLVMAVVQAVAAS